MTSAIGHFYSRLNEMTVREHCELIHATIERVRDAIRDPSTPVGADVGKSPTPTAMMMCDDMPGIARRIRIDLHTPVERAIHDAMTAVERAGADARLTKAINLLAEAKNEVSDFVEAQPGFTCTPLLAGNPRLDAEIAEGLSGLSDAVRYAITKQANDIVGLWAPGNRRLEQAIVCALIQRERRLVVHGGPTVTARRVVGSVEGSTAPAD